MNFLENTSLKIGFNDSYYYHKKYSVYRNGNAFMIYYLSSLVMYGMYFS